MTRASTRSAQPSGRSRNRNEADSSTGSSGTANFAQCLGPQPIRGVQFRQQPLGEGGRQSARSAGDIPKPGRNVLIVHPTQRPPGCRQSLRKQFRIDVAPGIKMVGQPEMTFACAVCLGDIMARRWQRPSRRQSFWYFRSAHASDPACAPSRPSHPGGFFLPRTVPVTNENQPPASEEPHDQDDRSPGPHHLPRERRGRHRLRCTGRGDPPGLRPAARLPDPAHPGPP